MFRIRKQHRDALEVAAWETFEDRMVPHLQKHFAEECDELGEAGVRSWIQHGIQRSAVYGIVSQRNRRKYIDLMFALGKDFDVDPELPWAKEILHQDVDSTSRVERLHTEALIYLSEEEES